MPADIPSVYVDANIFIYAMETDGARGTQARRWMARVDRGTLRAVTSELTLAEVLPHPLARTDQALVDGYCRLLVSRATFSVVPIERSVLVQAAALRARSNVALPDAIHVATAIGAGCTGFPTEDSRIHLPDALRRLTLLDEPTA